MLEFKPITVNGNLYSYTAFEDGKELGTCEFTVDNQYAEIVHIKVLNDDSLIIEGLIRSALNFAANKNAYIAKANPNTENCEILKKMGFKNINGILENDIPSALQCSCNSFA